MGIQRIRHRLDRKEYRGASSKAKGGASNAQARSPEIMEELIDLAEAGKLRPVLGHV